MPFLEVRPFGRRIIYFVFVVVPVEDLKPMFSFQDFFKTLDHSMNFNFYLIGKSTFGATFRAMAASKKKIKTAKNCNGYQNSNGNKSSKINSKSIGTSAKTNGSNSTKKAAITAKDFRDVSQTEGAENTARFQTDKNRGHGEKVIDQNNCS